MINESDLVILLKEYKDLSYKYYKYKDYYNKLKIKENKYFSYLSLYYFNNNEKKNLKINSYFGSGYKRLKLISIGRLANNKEKEICGHIFPIGYKIRKKISNEQKIFCTIEFLSNGIIIETDDLIKWNNWEQFCNETNCNESIEQFCGLNLIGIKKLINEL